MTTIDTIRRRYMICFDFGLNEVDALIGHGIQTDADDDISILCCPYKYNDMERNLI